MDIIPQLDIRFDINGAGVKGATLEEVLRWVHEQFVMRRR
jgi:hypothetical protein